MKNWIIQDWTGQEMNFGTFKTFGDAWAYLQKKFSRDTDLQEYEVVQKGDK